MIDRACEAKHADPCEVISETEFDEFPDRSGLQINSHAQGFHNRGGFVYAHANSRLMQAKRER